MRKGFTKIPNSILDQSLPIEAIGLYTWLSVNADKEGRVALSLNDISRMTGLEKMKVRRYIEKFKLTQLVTQLPTQLATHLPNVTTICYLSSYKAEKVDADTTSDTTSDIVPDTLRAYKNDNNNIMSLSKTKEDKPPLSPLGKTDSGWSMLPEEMKPIVVEWLDYKREKKQTYKPTGFKTFCKKLLQLSGGDPNKARQIVEHSMASNYSGIFELKNYGTTQTDRNGTGGSPSNEQVIDDMFANIKQLREREAAGYDPEVRPF